MINLKFYLRNKSIYFRYRPNKQFDLALSTPYSIEPDNWDAENQCWTLTQYIKGAKTSEKKLINHNIESFNRKLTNFKSDLIAFIENHLNYSAPNLKIAIKDYINATYFGHRNNHSIDKNKKPEFFNQLIEHFVEYRSIDDLTKGTRALAANTVKRYNTLKNVLLKFNKNLKVTDINDQFRNQFVRYLNTNSYALNTQVKFLKDIKWLCKYADTDYDISKEVLYWKIENSPENVAELITFNFEELKKLTIAEMPTKSLDEARDHLLISCYTSVRISELFTLKKENIVNGRYLKVFEQKNSGKKSQGIKFVFLMDEVISILNKRGGEFPPTTSQKQYNLNIKKVCKIARLTRLVEGGKTEIMSGLKRKRKVTGQLCDFVSSHCGRATFVTLFENIVGKHAVSLQTNHSDLKMVDHYNKTDYEEIALKKSIEFGEIFKGSMSTQS